MGVGAFIIGVSQIPSFFLSIVRFVTEGKSSNSNYVCNAHLHWHTHINLHN